MEFLRLQYQENTVYREAVLRRFRDGSHGKNPFTGQDIRLVEVELREHLEATGLLDDQSFNEVFDRFVESIINGVTWGLLMQHDKAGEDDHHRFCIHEQNGEALMPYLHELWTGLQST